MANNFVALTSFHTAQNADFYKMILDSEGVECFLQGDHTNTAAPHYTFTTGGVKLMVRANEVDRALALLRQHPDSDPSLFSNPPNPSSHPLTWQTLLRNNLGLLIIFALMLAAALVILVYQYNHHGSLF